LKACWPRRRATAAAWGLAISVSKDSPELVADQPQVEALIDRALELDEDFDFGAIHGFLVTHESSRLAGKGDFTERSRKHFQRAMELSGGKMAGPLVVRAAFPMLLVLLVGVLLISYFPPLTTVLPRWLGH
jgi:hypothetical protein